MAFIGEIKKRTYTHGGLSVDTPAGMAIKDNGGHPHVIDPSRVYEVVELVARWDRAYLMDDWLCDNLEYGFWDTDCTYVVVLPEEIRTLYRLCKEVAENPALLRERFPQVLDYRGERTDEEMLSEIGLAKDSLEPILDELDDADVHWTYERSF